MMVFSLMVSLWLKVVGAAIHKLWSPPLFELHATHLRIEQKDFGYLYVVIHICNFMGIVTVYNWKLTCVLVRQTFFYTVFFSFILFRAVVSKTCSFFVRVCSGFWSRFWSVQYELILCVLSCLWNVQLYLELFLFPREYSERILVFLQILRVLPLISRRMYLKEK